MGGDKASPCFQRQLFNIAYKKCVRILKHLEGAFWRNVRP